MNWHHFHASASIALLRTLLIIVNIIFMISGGILVVIGIILRSQLADLLDVSPEMSTSSPYVLISLGVFIFFIGLFAFWCTIKGHTSLLYIYSIIILLIFFVEILLAITVLMKKRTYEETFTNSVKIVMEQYPHERTSSNIDRLQNTLSCCGINSYTDWFQTPYGNLLNQVPKSCCKTPLTHTCTRTNLTKDNLPVDINIDGCYTTVISIIKNNYPIFGGIIAAIAFFPLISIILACCLACQMTKHRYEQVN